MNTLTVKHYVLDNDIVTLKADKTHASKSAEINRVLIDLGNRGKTLPFYAIYPPDGSDPITFGGPVTQSRILEELAKAGPSRQLSKSADTAMRLPK